MKEEVRVAAVQMDMHWLDPEANLAKMRKALEAISLQGPVDLVVFPELANSGYLKGRDKTFGKQYVKVAERVPGPFTEALGELARKHSVYIITGFLELHPLITATLYNSALLIAPSGRVIGVHHKMHIPGEEKHYFYPGNTADVFDTDLGKLAMEVCADKNYPELARIQSLKGAEIICAVSNTPKGDKEVPGRAYHVVGCRAQENGNFFLNCNRVGREEDLAFNGQSAIAAPTGELLAFSEGDEEEVLYATLKADILYEQRVLMTRFRDRRPELYSLITQPF